MAREWAGANGFSLEARMATGVGLDLREIEGLSHALRAAQVPKPGEKSERCNVVPFARSGKQALRRLPRYPNQILAPQTGANRVRFVAGYLEWLASHNRATGAQDRLRDTVRFLNARAKATTHRTPEPKKGLAPEQRERLFAVIEPSSPQNPFKNEAVRYRNLAVVTCLDESGMRRGELVGLKIPDIDFRKLTISIHRRPPDPQDPRRERPKTKTNARAVPMRPELADILFDYISVWRRAEPGARMHGYLFVSHGGTRPGAPLSPRSLGKTFDALQHVLGFNLHPHMLRPTWNDRFSATIDRKARHGGQTPEASEERIRNFLMGWSPNSKMAARYSRRHVERAARDALNGLHEGLYEGE
jgi:integrase